MANDDFDSEEITVTIPGLANAIATGSATALVFDDPRDARAHALTSETIAMRKTVRS